MRFTYLVFITLVLGGCATSPVYNPMLATTPQEILLNESGLKAVQDGMSETEVHGIMGQELVIGYEYKAPDYKPLTIPNPYRSETIKGSDYTIEYYIEAIRQPDGVVSDNELMPLVFKDGKLIGRGWPLANSIRPTPA